MNGRARVEIIEIDLSSRVPSFPGIYGAMVLNTSKGDVLNPRLITSEAELFRRMLSTDRILPRDPIGLFEAKVFLAKSNKLWISRPDTGAAFGGAYLAQDIPVSSMAVSVNQGLSGLFLRTTTDAEAEWSKFLYETLSDGDVIQLSGTSLPAPLVAGVNYFALKFSDKYGLRVCASQKDALSGKYIVLTSSGSGVTVNLTPDDVNGEQQYAVADPNGYELDTSDGKASGFTSTFTVDIEGDYLNVPREFYRAAKTGDKLTLSAVAGDLPSVDSGLPLDTTESYYVISVPQEGVNADKYKVQLARTEALALSEEAIGLNSTGGPTFAISLAGRAVSSEATLDVDTDMFSVAKEFYELLETDDVVRMTATTMPSGPAVAATTDLYVIKSPIANSIALSLTKGGSSADWTSAGDTIVLTCSSKSVMCNPTIDRSKDALSVSEMFYETTETGYTVTLASDGVLPKGLNAGPYYVIKTATAQTIKLASTEGNAEAGIPVDILDAGTLDALQNQYHHILDTHNELYTGYKRRVGYLHTSTPTDEEIYYRLYHYPYGDESTWSDFDQACADMVKEPGAFLVLLYKKYDDQYLEVERWTCSRDESHRNGYGQNIYVEKVFEVSNYARWKDNKAVNKNVYPCNQTTYAKLTGGALGHAATTGECITALKLFGNKRRYPITLVMDAGWSIPAYQQAIIDLCESRGATLGILSTPIEVEQSSNYLEDLIAYRRKSLITSTSHAALYTPHVKIYDEGNDREIYVSPTGHVGAQISHTAENYEPWFAPAGNTRGVLNVLGVAREFNDGDEDALYDAGINPIDFHEVYGIRIWGQKTLLNRASALDRVNVRMLLIVIEPAIEALLMDYVFELNDEFSRSMLVSKLTPYLASIKARRGLYDFKVICDTSNNTPEVIDNNEMVVDVPVQPTRVGELMRGRLTITSTGATFTIAS